MARGGQLRIRVVGDTSNLRKSLGKGTRQIGAFAKKAAKVGAAGVAALGAAAVAGAAKVASFGDDIAKSARKAGLGVEQFQELRFAFKQGGVEAGTFDTAVQKFNKRLGESATMGGTADEAFERLGISLRDADGNVRSASGAMDEVLPKLANIQSDAERAAIAGDMFGQRAGPELAAALADGGKGIDAARQKAQDLGIVMSESATKKAEKFTDAFDDLKQSALGLLRGGLTPMMGWLADDAMPFIQSEVIPRLKEFGKWLGPRLEAAAQNVITFFQGKVIPAFQRLSDWWDTNGPAVVAHVDRVWSTLQTLGRVVGTVIGTVTGWLSKFGDSSSEQTKAAGEAFQRARRIIESAIDAVTAIFKFFVATAEAIWRTWGDTILRFLKEIWSSVEQVINGALKVIEGVFETFAGLFTGDWSRMWDGIKQIFAGMWDAINGLLDAAFAALRGTFSVIRKALTSVWSDLWGAIRRLASSALDAVVEFVRGLPGRARDALAAAWGAYREFWRQVFTQIQEFVSDRVDDIIGFFADLPDNIIRAAAMLGGKVGSFVYRQMQIVWEQVKDVGGDIITWFKNLPGKIVDALKGLGEKIADKFTFDLPGINFSGEPEGDGPGMGAPAVGGTAAKRAAAAAEGLPIRRTSAYRTPAENRAAGGSPTSHHLNKQNPAVDYGGPTWALDLFAQRLRQMGNWRELLWRTKGHYDHVHVAHEGGRVTGGGVAPLPGEVIAKLQSGETVLPRGASFGGGEGESTRVLRRIEKRLGEGQQIVVDREVLGEVVRDEFHRMGRDNISAGVPQ